MNSRAADNGHTNVARFLLRAGKASPDAADAEGRTPTWLACRGGYAQMLEILVGAGGDFGTESGAKAGATCAQVAAVNGHLDVIRLLVQFGLSQGDLDRSVFLGFLVLLLF